MTYGSLSNYRLGNKYLLTELLGQGGFGEVYKAQNLYLNRLQAIKVLLDNHFNNPTFQQRFIREAQTLAGLSHPNILPVYDFEIEGNRAYLVMPFISGGTLQSILQQQGPLSLTDTEFYLRQICAALDYAHARNVVHLDLKPLNLLHQDGILLLSDFGLAHLLKEGAVEGGTSLRFGSPHYMAPEHLRGQPQQRSDIYALGIILFQMLAGAVPFRGPNPESIMIQHIMEPPPSVRESRPELPPSLDTVLGRALAKKPEERYPTAGKLLEDYKGAVSARAFQAEATKTYPPTPPLQHNPAPVKQSYQDVGVKSSQPNIPVSQPLPRNSALPPLPQPTLSDTSMSSAAMRQQSVPSSTSEPSILPHRWGIAIAAFFFLLVIGSSSTWSNLQLPLLLAYHYSTLSITYLFTILTGAFAITASFSSYFHKRWGLRTTATIGAILGGAGILLSGFASNLLVLYFTFGILGGAGIGLGYITALTMLLQLFSEKRGLIIGLGLASSVLGGITIGPLAKSLVYSIGLTPAFIMLGIGYIVLAVFLARAFRSAPAIQSLIGSFTLGRALRTPTWYLLWLMIVLNVIATNSVSLIYVFGISFRAISTFSLAVAISAIAGRFLWGWLSDGLNRSILLTLLFIIQSIAFFFLLPSGSLSLYLLIVIGLCQGGIYSIIPACAADFFGVRNISSIYGLLLTAFLVGSLASQSLLSGVSRYELPLIAFGILIVGAVLSLTTFVIKRRQNKVVKA